MFIQKSFKETKFGVLYLIPTPIGNLEDITYRAVRMLTEVNVIAAEDTSHTQKLLSNFDINTILLSYIEHSKHSIINLLIKKLYKGKYVGIVSVHRMSEDRVSIH